MKLFELFRPTIHTRQMTADFDVRGMSSKTPSDEDGMYAKVTHPSHTPNEVKKTTHMPSELMYDGYFQFVQAIQREMLHNPFLPKVYTIDIKRAKNGQTRPSYRIERLHSYTELPAEAIAAIGRSCFPEFDEAMFDADPADVDVYIHRNHHMWGAICEAIRKFTELDDTETFGEPTPHLATACRLVSGAVRRLGRPFGLDMHAGNFMVRITSTGPQLVITDPIDDMGRSIVRN